MKPLLVRNNSRSYQRSVRKSGKYCAIRKRRRVPAFEFLSSDLFNSLVDLRWRWVLVIYTFSFISTWFVFGLLWWVIAFAHGDLETPVTERDSEPCVTLINDMTSSFMFSMETQYTTGFGTRAPTTECPEAVFLLCVQSIFGLLLQSIMVGVIFVKLVSAKARSQAIIFSENAVICLRDGKLSLIFRVADVRKSRLVGCNIRAWLLKHRFTQEGEVLPYHKTQLKVTVENGGQDFFLLWPVFAVHKIDDTSPFYDLSAKDLLGSQFEVVISLVCTVETTGQQTEARRSYIPSDLRWGHRFQNMIVRNENGLHFDYAFFDKTVCVDTATCSARQLDLLYRFPRTDDILIFDENDESSSKQEEDEEEESVGLWLTTEHNRKHPK